MTQVQQRVQVGTSWDGTPVHLDQFNPELILQCIKWAEQDVDFAERLADGSVSMYGGTWNQGLWGQASTDDIAKAQEQDTDLFATAGDFLGAMNVCGSSFCMAGQAVVSSRYRLLYNDGDQQAHACIAVERTGEKNKFGFDIYRDVPGAVRQEISIVAGELMGLTMMENSHFFNGDNTLDYLMARANGMCEMRRIPLLFPDFVCDRATSTQDGYEEWADLDDEDY